MAISEKDIEKAISALNSSTSPVAVGRVRRRSYGSPSTSSSSSSHESPSLDSWEQYQARLASFSSARWFAKPPFAHASTCALHGWRVVDVDRLECSVCHQHLAYSYPSELLSAEIEQRCAAEFTAQLKESHVDLCPWRSSSCPESFASSLGASSLSPVAKNTKLATPSPSPPPPPLRGLSAQATAHLLLNAFRSRLQSFVTVEDSLPRLRLPSAVPRLAPEFVSRLYNVVSHEELHSLIVSELQTSELTLNAFSHTCVVLALFGWSLLPLHWTLQGGGGSSSISIPERATIRADRYLLTCSQCQRSIGLWNFEAYSNESVLQLGSATSLETGSKRTREDMEASSTGRADLVSGDGGNSHTAATATSNATAPLASDATSEDNGSNSTTAEEASSKRMRASNGSSLEPQTSATKPPALDAIAEHRLFCPWRSAGATESSTLDAGWIGALSAMCKRNRGSSSSDRSSSGSADANTLTPSDSLEQLKRLITFLRTEI